MLGVVFAVAVGLCGVAPAVAQSPPAAAAQAAPADEERLTQAQLEQVFAPVALYPDDLLMQVLIAATYPLEIVQAHRWLGQDDHAALRGDALVQALNGQSWDPSVKSLVPFPDVLGLMNEQLDWTQQMGDAVLAQQDDVMNAIQVLRGRAQANGSLQTGPQQTVTVTQNVTVAPAQGAAVQPPAQTIAIAPTDPGQVYVPAYDPSVVYGSWPYPENPPYYYPPPIGWGVGNAILTGMAFAGSVAVVDSLWGWARPGWGRGDVDIDVNRFNSINVNRDRITNNRWQHDVTHRHGVNYGSDRVRDRVGGRRPGGGGVDRAAAREQFRGRLQQANTDHPNLGDRLPGRDGANRPNLGGGGGRPDGSRPNIADRLPDRDGANRPNLGGGGGRPDGSRPNIADRLPDRDGANRPNLGGGGGRPDGSRPNIADRLPDRDGANRPNLGGSGGRPDGNRPNIADRLPNRDGANRPNLGGGGGRPDGNRPNIADRLPNRDGANRPNLGGGGRRPEGQRPSLGGNRGQGGARPVANRPAVQHRPSGRPQTRPAATRQAPQGLRGVGQGGHERAAASRGRASRQGQPAARARAQQRQTAQRPHGGGGGGRAARGGGGRRHR
ncbi:DUF3300 domain-containing protein [Roseomonas sp. HJA6]|uniref:DUF3300 domain-containing protein n=1 Tax=Roseomonas alba TaxID=2846776 RepID=A0ABS7AHG4_9PROT|nr:DUF3300 domain-containing protein [Neoroseomonas alba]MBW6401746.1 DUF3300 domain-containing protein [Neoroseomonas alba]